MFLFFGYQALYPAKFELNRLYSENKEYYLETVYYSSYSGDREGQTKIYKAKDNTFIYGLNIGVNPSVTYLSNDGNKIATLNWYDWAVDIYSIGKLVKSISICDISDCESTNESQECSLLYSNSKIRKLKNPEADPLTSFFNMFLYEIDTITNGQAYYIYKEDANPMQVFADKYPKFSYQDTLFIITGQMKVCKIDMNNYNYSLSEFSSEYSYLKEIANNKKSYEQVYQYECISFPELKNNKKLNQVFGEKFDYCFDYGSGKQCSINEDSILFHNIYFGGLLDRQGRFEVTKLKISVYIDSLEFKNFIENLEFEPLDMPEIVDKWYYWVDIFFCKKDINESYKDKLLQDSIYEAERDSLCLLDTIDGIYIPKDFTDCFHQLDSLLPQETITKIDSMKNSYDMTEYHFGLGRILRSRWNLWGGSRLVKYLNDCGLTDADNMSGKILKSYYYYRHNIEKSLDDIIEEEKMEFEERRKSYEIKRP